MTFLVISLYINNSYIIKFVQTCMNIRYHFIINMNITQIFITY